MRIFSTKVIFIGICILGTCRAQDSSNSSSTDASNANSNSNANSTGGSGSTNKSASTGGSSSQNNPLVFGNVKISNQPSAEVTTAGYDVTAYLAARVSDSILNSLAGSPVPASDPKSLGAHEPSYKILVVNDKTTADHLRIYRTMLSQIDYVIDQGNVSDAIFQSQAERPTSVRLQPNDAQLATIQSINSLLASKHYPAPYQIALDSGLKLKLAVNDAVLSSAATGDQKLTPYNTAPGPLDFLSDSLKNLQLAGDFKEISLDSGASQLNALASMAAANGAATIPTGYAVPYIGQAQAAVDAVTGLGQSIAKFYSLFRSNDDISGVSLKIPSEALTALVIKRLKIGQAALGCKIHCYYSDLLVGDEQSSGIMDELNKLMIVADKVTQDLARIDPQNGIVPNGSGVKAPVTVTTDEEKDAVLNAYAMFAQTAPTYAAPPVPGAGDTGTQKGANSANGALSALQKQLQAYEQTVTQLFAMLYGTSDSSKNGQSASDNSGNNGNARTQTPATDFSGTNQYQNVAAPISITPTMSPQITINTAGTPSAGGKTTGTQSSSVPGSNNPSDPTSGADSSNGSATQQSGSTASGPPLAAILQDEEMRNLRLEGYLLYLNILSAAGANKTENGWWSSDMTSNAGVAVDFFLVDQGGEVIDSSAENGQSPYLPAIERGWAERLPTIVTTDPNVKTKTAIWKSDDTEPQSRFTVTPVGQQSADDGQGTPTSGYSAQGTKSRH